MTLVAETLTPLAVGIAERHQNLDLIPEAGATPSLTLHDALAIGNQLVHLAAFTKGA